MNQQTVEMLTLVFAGEAALMMTIMCVLMITRSLRARRQDKEAGNALAQQVLKSEDERQAALKEAFSECYEMDDEELKKVVDEFIARERAFYKTLISVYVNRDGEQFKNLTDSLNEVVDSYTDLAKTAEPTANSEALEALEQKNEALSKELDESKDVMDGLMSEYKATFDKTGKKEAVDSTDEEADPSPEVDEENVEVESEEIATEAEDVATDLEATEVEQQDDAIPTLEEVADPAQQNDLSELDELLEEATEAVDEDSSLDDLELDLPEDEVAEPDEEDLALSVDDIDALLNEANDEKEPEAQATTDAGSTDQDAVEVDIDRLLDTSEIADVDPEESNVSQQVEETSTVSDAAEPESSADVGMSMDEIDALLNGDSVGEIESDTTNSTDDLLADLDIDIDSIVAEASSENEDTSVTDQLEDVIEEAQNDVEDAEAILDEMLSEIDEVSLDDIDIDDIDIDDILGEEESESPLAEKPEKEEA